MTTERKRAIITISATLVIGLLIGSLATGLWGRRHYGQRTERGRKEMKMNFETKILKVVDADQEQVKKLEPIIKKTTAQIDSLQHKTDGEVRLLLDGLDGELKTILREDQYQKFKAFVTKVKGFKNRGGGDRHSREGDKK